MCTIALMPSTEMWKFNRRSSSSQLSIFFFISGRLKWNTSRIKSYNELLIACSWQTNKGLKTELNEFHWCLYRIIGIIKYWSHFRSRMRTIAFQYRFSIEFLISFFFFIFLFYVEMKRKCQCKLWTVDSLKMDISLSSTQKEFLFGM